MIRRLTVAAALAAAAISTGPAAVADPSSSDNNPGRYSTDVPNMVYDVTLNQPCTNISRFVFGRGPAGEALQCHYIPNQYPPVYKPNGYWIASYPLYGVQEIGSPCPDPHAAAQAPDGRPLLCLGAKGWQAGVFTGSGFFPFPP